MSEKPTSRTSSRTAAPSPTASSAPPPAACCARSAWATTTGRSRRSASRRRGTRSPRATCQPRPAREGGEGRACTPAAASRWSSAPSRCPTASRWATRACTSRWCRARSSPTRSRRSFGAERLDGAVLLAGCDKSLPGMLMAAARLDVSAVFLYAGSTLPGPGRRQGRHDHRRVRGGRRVRARADHARGGRRDRARDLSGRGRLRRHVHRQHDGQRRRGAGHVAAGLGRAARRRPSPRRVRRRVRRGRRRAAAPGHHHARHPHEGGVRERDRRRHGARRLDQRRAAPARDRPRGRGRR